MSAVKGGSHGQGVYSNRMHSPAWTRDLPRWHWRYWLQGKRWRHMDTLYYNGVDRRHYQTDKQRARAVLAEQFDTNLTAMYARYQASKGYNYP
jgi:hypothetical protein